MEGEFTPPNLGLAPLHQRASSVLSIGLYNEEPGHSPERHSSYEPQRNPESSKILNMVPAIPDPEIIKPRDDKPGDSPSKYTQRYFVWTFFFIMFCASFIATGILANEYANKGEVLQRNSALEM